MKKSDSSIQFDKLMSAMDRYGVDADDREQLLAFIYAVFYEYMKLLYKSKKK